MAEEERSAENAPLQEEIGNDELAALLGEFNIAKADAPVLAAPDLSSFPPSEPMDDAISMDELAALGLATSSPTPAPPPVAAPPNPALAPNPAPAPPPPNEPRLPELTAEDHIAPDAGLSLLMDVPLRVSIELGRVSMTLQQVLELGRGSIIELERLAGEPVDILVNDRLIGRGEVVVIDEYFGVKITELIEPKG